jgi:hypothetical protein
MTPRERAAYNAGVETARQMALTAAVTNSGWAPGRS